MPRPVVSSLSRRGLLALAALGSGAALAACEQNTASGPGSASSVTVTPSPVGSPDRLLVEAALGQATSLLALVNRLAGRRALRRRIAPLRDLHRAQVEVLSTALTPEPAAPSTAPAPNAGPLAAMLAAEASWLSDLEAGADTAQDGSVARLLAVLAAGTAMTLDAVSPQPLPDRRAPDAPPGDEDVLQQALAGEHAAVYAYGVIGGRTSQSDDAALFAALTAAYDAHRARRDDLEGAVRALGAEPTAAEVAYDVPPPDSRAAVVIAAGRVERAAAEEYAALVAASPPGSRAWAAGLVRDAALRARGFGLTAEPFFGAPELAGA